MAILLAKSLYYSIHPGTGGHLKSEELAIYVQLSDASNCNITIKKDFSLMRQMDDLIVPFPIETIDPTASSDVRL